MSGEGKIPDTTRCIQIRIKKPLILSKGENLIIDEISIYERRKKSHPEATQILPTERWGKGLTTAK
jgi:hypothetical protein